MNRVLTDEDRIRRAEIIAERRNVEFYDGNETDNESKKRRRKEDTNNSDNGVFVYLLWIILRKKYSKCDNGQYKKCNSIRY